MRPVDAEISQNFGDNPTANLPADSWLIQTFGNYQPNGHTGVDFAVPVGTPVRAVASGVVKHAGWYSGSYADNPYWIAPSFAGYVLVIDHGDFVGIYAHLSHSSVTVGEGVDAGQTVAFSGNTGGSTGPHLHFEVLPNGWDFNNGMYGRVNPGPYMDAAAPSFTITPASIIINELQEAGVALELSDLQAIQGIVQTERETVINEVRANAAATVTAVTEALDKAVWAVKTFDQSTDNENGDRIILDFRAQLQSIRDEFKGKDAA